MPCKSRAQHNLMVAASEDEKVARKYNIDQNVASEFVKADEKEGLWQDDGDDEVDAAAAAGMSLEEAKYLVPPAALKFYTIND